MNEFVSWARRINLAIMTEVVFMAISLDWEWSELRTSSADEFGIVWADEIGIAADRFLNADVFAESGRAELRMTRTAIATDNSLEKRKRVEPSPENSYSQFRITFIMRSYCKNPE